jgi:hypothetical protein
MSRRGQLFSVALVVLVVALAGGGPLGAAPSNDNFASAVVIAGSGSLSADNSGATKQAGEPDHAGDMGGKSIWYAWTPGFTGTASVETVGSSFDTLLAVYTGTTVSGLTAVASDDDVDQLGSVSRVCFPVSAASTYMIAVDGYAGASGAITLDYGQKGDSAPCPTLPPTIVSGPQPRVNDVLVAAAGSFVADGGAAPSYQWNRCAELGCSPIDGATHSTYVVEPRDVGTAIRVDEQITTASGTALNTSAPTAVVAVAATAPPTTHPNGRIFWATQLPVNPLVERIDSMLPDGTSVQHLTSSIFPAFATEPAASPDGRLLAFVNVPQGGGGDVWLMNSDGSDPVDLGVQGSFPTWSPDGTRLAFVTGNGIDSLDENGDELLLLPLPSGSLGPGLAWSPDGTKIAFSYRPPGRTDVDVAVVSADGRGTITTLASDPSITSNPIDNHDPSWSPTGDKIAFERGPLSGTPLADGDVYVMNADGSGQTKVYDGDGSHVAIGGAAWSPDGTKILFSITDPAANSSELYTVPAAGGQATHLPGDGVHNRPVSWARAVSYTLAVSKGGTGSGTVTSTPAGIACGGSCTATFADPTSVTLTAAPAAGSTFSGWSGACSGTGPCIVTTLGDRSVTATFAPVSSGGGSGGGGGGGGGGGSSSLALSVSPGSQTVTSGSPASWTISVTNSGGAYLYAVGVRAATAPGCGIPSSFADTASLMAPGVTISYGCSLAGVMSSMTNTVVATATTGPGDVLTQTATATVSVQAPASPTPAPQTPPPRTPSKVTRPHAITGTSRADHLNGTATADVIDGLAGNDSINGGQGNDTLFGGPGNDRLNGGPGKDKVYGGAGNDTILAADGTKDVVDCGPGRDTLIADKSDAVAKNCELVHRR